MEKNTEREMEAGLRQGFRLIGATVNIRLTMGAFRASIGVSAVVFLESLVCSLLKAHVH